MTPHIEIRELTEHERLHLIHDKSQAIGDFVEWLAEKGFRICREHAHTEDCYDVLGGDGLPTCELRDGQYIADYTPITKRLAEYFDIDLNKLETEKRQMLADIRKGRAAEKIDRELGL